MANTKISQLPAASTINPAADVAPIVHSGVTQKATPNLIVQSVLPSPGPIGSVTPNTAQFASLTLVGASGLQKAVAGLFTDAVAGTDYLGPTTGSAIQKANGSGGLTSAISGTDYAPATSGSSILYGNGAGGFSNVTVGSGLTFVGGTLSSSAGSGTVTNVSVVTANGLAGTVANPGSTPAITLSTTVTGLLKGNGTAVSAAVSGTDYAPATSGSSILYANGAGGFSDVTIGSNLTFAGGTLSATGGGGGGMVYPGAGIPNSTGTSWGTSYGTSGVNSVVLRDSSGNISTNSIFEGYSVLVASGTTTTLTASSFPNWYVTGSGGQTFQLPDATTLPDGATYTFNNNQSSGVITLNNNSGSSIIPGGIGSGGYVTLVLQTNVSAAGTWDYHFQTPANVSWTTNTFNYPGSFTGGTWNGSTVAVNRGGTGVATITGLIKGNGTSAFTAAVAGTDYAGLASANTFTSDQVISVSSATDALRITQTGAGNALVVEDSTNPDSTPFVIDQSGNVVSGNTTTFSTGLSIAPQFSLGNIGNGSGAGITIAKFRNAASFGPDFEFTKSRASALGVNALVSGTDLLGTITFSGADGTGYVQAASIAGWTDGTPGTNDMPGRLVFSTTKDGASSPTEAMRIDSAQNIGVGGAASSGRTIDIYKNITGSTSAYGVNQRGQVQTGVTNDAVGFRNVTNTITGFTLPNYSGFCAAQGTLSGTVTNQYGYLAEASLTGATNNYGFYSAIASGTGRYNFYAAGTADNYFAGAVTIGGTTTLATSLNGLLKSTAGAVSTATSGTDYAPATSGSSILYGNGSGGFSPVTIGSNLTFAAGTLSATGAAAFPSGTVMLFVQTSAPTGWTKSITHDNKALRVVSGTASSGGSIAFTTAFANGNTGATTLSEAQIPSHTHGISGQRLSSLSTGSVNWLTGNGTSVLSAATGGGGSHTHGLSLDVQYVDVIIATKD
jgi:hypothetical protein